MKTIKNKLFAANALSKNSANHILGGAQTWTKSDSDTASEGAYDVEKITKDENGQNSTQDSFNTGSTNKDRPLED